MRVNVANIIVLWLLIVACDASSAWGKQSGLKSYTCSVLMYHVEEGHKRLVDRTQQWFQSPYNFREDGTLSSLDGKERGYTFLRNREGLYTNFEGLATVIYGMNEIELPYILLPDKKAFYQQGSKSARDRFAGLLCDVILVKPNQPGKKASSRYNKLWIAQQYPILLRTEIYEDNKLVRVSEVSKLQINPKIPAEVFQLKLQDTLIKIPKPVQGWLHLPLYLENLHTLRNMEADLDLTTLVERFKKVKRGNMQNPLIPLFIPVGYDLFYLSQEEIQPPERLVAIFLNQSTGDTITIEQVPANASIGNVKDREVSLSQRVVERKSKMLVWQELKGVDEDISITVRVTESDIKPEDVQRIEQYLVPLSEATKPEALLIKSSASVGFGLFVPQYIPNGYRLNKVNRSIQKISVPSSEVTTFVFSVEYVKSGSIIRIEEFQGRGKVRIGTEGELIRGNNIEMWFLPKRDSGRSLLVMEIEGTMIRIEADLSKEEMIAVAQSFRPQRGEEKGY